MVIIVVAAISIIITSRAGFKHTLNRSRDGHKNIRTVRTGGTSSTVASNYTDPTPTHGGLTTVLPPPLTVKPRTV